MFRNLLFLWIFKTLLVSLVVRVPPKFLSFCLLVLDQEKSVHTHCLKAASESGLHLANPRSWIHSRMLRNVNVSWSPVRGGFCLGKLYHTVMRSFSVSTAQSSYSLNTWNKKLYSPVWTAVKALSISIGDCVLYIGVFSLPPAF